MACFLPFRPFLFPRPLGSSVSKGVRLQSSNRNILSCACAPPRRLHLEPAASLPVCLVNPIHTFEKPLASQALLPFSVWRIQKPFLFTLLLRERPGTVALIPGSHTLGFGYPLDVSSTFKPLEASFSSQHSGASPFRAFLLLSDRRRLSSPLSALALLHQISRT
jgi:hypothetical protein